jgi:hypothetical protein
LAIAKKAAEGRGSPVTLGILFLPWRVAVDPSSPEASSEFYTTYKKWRVIRSALAESTYKPPIACLVDTETFNAKVSANTQTITDLYEAYDQFLRAVVKPVDVFWYGFGESPAPAEPEEWGRHPFSAPFPGMSNLGFELYYKGEIGLQREATHRAREFAAELGVPEITAWVAAPGCGQEFRWTKDATGKNLYHEWVWDAGPACWYDREMGRELYGAWQAARPRRFMEAPNTVCVYPHVFDPRIVDPDRTHLLAFLQGATE